MPQKRFAKLDTNHDGVVTQDEYLAAATTLFKQLDTAGTGKVTAAEIAILAKNAGSGHPRCRSHRQAHGYERRWRGLAG